MLKSATQGGWSLVELMAAIAIVVLLIAAASPNISAWINNARIRTVAEGLQASLQFARAEAVRRNTTVSLYLTNNVGSDCALSGTVPFWVVSQNSPEGACDNNTNILQRAESREGGSLVQLYSNMSTISFDGLGRATTGAALICAGISAVNATCLAEKPEQQLALQISAGGQVRMCSNSRPAGDPQRC
ncbi:GspH/FimT family pseudopilin [Massilia sp. W12]|uniref:GspH/FimT family pseudopilin n=1 Tax=Massilia sp. W12 TaxID=3126507 RepID=UPI0030CA8888